MKKKCLFAVLTAMIALFCSIGVFSAEVVDSGDCGESVTWSVYDDGTLVISGEGEMANYFQMEEAPWGVHSASIRSVLVEEGVTTVGDYAFLSLNAESISLPEGITFIGERAFAYCEKLTALTIPESVAVIDDYAFQSCTSLNKLTLLSPYTLFNGTNLFMLANENVVIHGHTGSTAQIFADANRFAFVSTGDEAPDLDSKLVASGECGDNAVWDLYASGKLVISGTGDMWDYGGGIFLWYQYRASIKTVIVEEGITSLGKNAFFNCGLQSIFLPESLETIGERAFASCIELNSLHLGANVSLIRNEAFFRCVGLTEIVVDEANSAYSSDEYGVLFNKNKTVLIQYPASNTQEAYHVPETVTTIEYRAFECADIGVLHLPASLTTIGAMAFLDSGNLTAVAVDEANEHFFAGEDGVLLSKDGTELYLYPMGKTEPSYAVPDGVSAIMEYAFWGSQLEMVTIPDGVKTIGQLAFGSSYSLAEVTVPKTVTTIAASAFNGCQSLQKVVILGRNTEIGRMVFTGVPRSLKLYGYEGSTAEAYAAANRLNFIAMEYEEIPGDINLDESVDITDALLLFMHSMLPKEYAIDYSGNIDFTEDGSIDIADALLLFMYSMLPEDYPIV